MDDATWDEILGTMTGGEPTAVDDAATDAAAPGADPSLTEAPTAEAVETDPPAAEDAEPTADETEEPVTDAAPPLDWRELPEAKQTLQELEQARQDAALFRLLKARAAEVRRIQQQQAFQQQLNELADGDSERYQTLTGLVAQATTPLSQAAQAQFHRAEGAEKAAAALLIAMDAVLDDETRTKILEEHAVLMGVEGVEIMQRLATAKRDAFQQYQTELSTKDRQIAELQRQLAAKTELAQREAAGSDAVDGGSGGNAPPDQRARLEAAKDMDEYFAAMFGHAA